MTLKELFDQAENGTLTYEQFMAACDGKAKFVDLSEGNYVSKQKYEADLAGKSKEIDTLNETIATRGTDLEELQKKLAEAGADAEKLTSLSNDFTALQSKYDSDMKQYKEQLKKQSYEFAVREFANGKQFSSNAAKRDFIQSMIAKDLKMDNGKIIGADDFVKMYSDDNADAFVVDADDYQDEEDTAPVKPHFVGATPGAEQPPVDSNEFAKAFHFMGVRPIPDGE